MKTKPTTKEREILDQKMINITENDQKINKLKAELMELRKAVMRLRETGMKKHNYEDSYICLMNWLDEIIRNL